MGKRATRRGAERPTTIAQIIDAAPIDEVAVVVQRLQRPPERGASTADTQFTDALRQMQAAEEAFRAARLAVREAARRIYEQSVGHWSTEEIETTTGYRD